MRGRGGCSLTSPTGKESARHFFSAIHQAQTGPSSDLPAPLPAVHAQRDLEVGRAACGAARSEPKRGKQSSLQGGDSSCGSAPPAHG